MSRCRRSSRRGGRSGRSPTSRSPRDALDGFVEAACIAPAPHHSRPWRLVVVDTADAKQQLADGMGDAWRTRPRSATACPPARIDELVDASHAQDHGRARARARVPHLGRARPLPRRRPASAPSGAWRCCRSAPRSRTSWSPRPTPGSRRAGWRHRSSAPRRPATRSRSPPSGSPTRWSWSATPTPPTSAAPRPPVPLDELRTFR